MSDLWESRLRVNTSRLTHRRAVSREKAGKHPTEEFCRVFAASAVTVVDTEQKGIAATLDAPNLNF